jgi:hypothetical protein
MSFDMSEKLPQPTFTEDLEAGESGPIEQLKEELRFCYAGIAIAVFGLCVTIFHFYLILRDNTTPSFLSTLAKGLYISLPISSLTAFITLITFPWIARPDRVRFAPLVVLFSHVVGSTLGAWVVGNHFIFAGRR